MKLKIIREAAGMSQAQLAALSGVGVHMIQHYEQGFRDINGARAITIFKLAKALDCNMEDLIETE